MWACFIPIDVSPRAGRIKVARKGPSATPTDPGTGRFELPAPSTRASPGEVSRVPGSIHEQTPTCLAQGPARPRSVPSPSPAWAGTKSPPRDGDGFDCAPDLRAAALVTLLFLQGVGIAEVSHGAGGDGRRSIPAGDAHSRQGLRNPVRTVRVSACPHRRPESLRQIRGRLGGHALTPAPCKPATALPLSARPRLADQVIFSIRRRPFPHFIRN